MSGLSALAQTFEENSKRQAADTMRAVQSALQQHEKHLIEQLASSEQSLNDAIQHREKSLLEQMEQSELEQREQRLQKALQSSEKGLIEAINQREKAIMSALQASETGLIEAINRREKSISERLTLAEQRSLSLAVTTWKYLGGTLIMLALVASGALWWTGQQIGNNLALIEQQEAAMAQSKVLGLTFHRQDGEQYIVLPLGWQTGREATLGSRTAIKIEKVE